MSFRVVCISRALGAGGETVGQLAAGRLGFRYVDEEIITRAARQARVDPALVAAAEHQQSLLQRLMTKLPTARDLAVIVGAAAGAPFDSRSAAEGLRISPEDLRLLIRGAIHEVALAGEAVIVAHAASMALAGSPGVLRVLVTASRETRAERVSQEQEVPASQATTLVATSDRERREYFHRFYGVEDELPTHYDLTLNTDIVSPERAAHIIASAFTPTE